MALSKTLVLSALLVPVLSLLGVGVVLLGLWDDGTTATYWCFKWRMARAWNGYASRKFIQNFEAGEKKPPSSSWLGNSTGLDCAKEVEAVDAVDTRSPQAVHTALLPFFVDKDIVEFGTHHGDGMNCFARVARSAVAIEPDETECPALQSRADALRSKGFRSYTVLCAGFPEAWRDADVFTWWQDLGWATWRNYRVLLDLKQLRDQGLVRQDAEAVLIFDPLIPIDRWSWYNLEHLFTVRRRVLFDEEDDCFKRAAWPNEPFSCATRAKGSFFVAGMPISNIPEHLS